MLNRKTLAAMLMAALPMSIMAEDGGGHGRIRVKVSAGKHVLMASFIDNATTRALIAKFPLTVPMMDLYSRELVYRFPEALPANETRTSDYEVGDIVYWAPRHSFVIMYAQNGERISDLQKLGRIESGVEALSRTGSTDVRFELLKD